MPRIRKILLWLLFAFFVYAIVTSPGQAANILQSAWDVVLNAVKGLGSFFDALLRRN